MSLGHQITFNGYDFSDILYIQKFNKGVRLGRSSDYSFRKNKKGADFRGTTSEVVTFSMDFLLKPGVDNAKEILANRLNVLEPKRLTISSEPGLVYYAFPQSSIESDETSIFGDGTIVWEIPDGVAYSIDEYTFTNKNGAGFDNYITVDNPGSEPMELSLEAIFKSDNGFLGLESSDRKSRVLFGNMDEVDKVPFNRSELLFDDHMYISRGWVLNSGKVPPVTANPKQQGTIGYTAETATEGFAHPTAYGTRVEDWYGPSLTKTIPMDSNGAYALDWGCTFRIDFNPTGAGAAEQFQVGHQSLTFLDQNNNIIIAVVFEDNHPTAKKTDFAIYVRDKRVYDSRNTNYYYFTARPGQGNHILVEKWNKMLQVTINAKAQGPDDAKGYNIQFFLEEDNVQLRKITWYAAKYKGFPAMTNNLLRAINLRAHNVQKWNDVPNKFMNNDNLFYAKEGQNIVCRLNGIDALRLRDIGSNTLTAPPGRTIFYISYSDFANTPEVKLKGKARFVI